MFFLTNQNCISKANFWKERSSKYLNLQASKYLEMLFENL